MQPDKAALLAHRKTETRRTQEDQPRPDQAAARKHIRLARTKTSIKTTGGPIHQPDHHLIVRPTRTHTRTGA